MNASPFDGFPATVLDAYRPEKWSSNVFTRERLDAKQRLLSLAKALEPILEELGLDLHLGASDEYPSLWNQKRVDAQWIFFWRTEEDRRALEAQVDLEKTLAASLADPTPMRRHAFLCLRLDVDGLELGLRVHRDAWVDRKNLARKVEVPEGRAALVELLLDMPPGVRAGLPSAAAPVLASEGEGALARLLSDEVGEDFAFLGVILARDEVVEAEAGLPEVLAPAFRALARAYAFSAWSQANDHVTTDEEFERRRAERDARRDELEADAARRRAEAEARQKEREEARRELEEQARREAAARAATPLRRPRHDEAEPQPEAQPQSQPQVQHPAAGRSPRPSHPRQGAAEPRKPRPEPPRERPKPAPTPAVPIPVEVGHMVKVGKGPLAGQLGTVQDIDSRGNARVMVGLLASRVHVDDLVGLGPAPHAEPSRGRR